MKKYEVVLNNGQSVFRELNAAKGLEKDGRGKIVKVETKTEIKTKKGKDIGKKE